MKRIYILVLALILTVGCTAIPPAASEGGDRPALPKTPPALTVQVGEKQVQAVLSTYSWTWPNGDGTNSGVEADGLHPLDMGDRLTPVPQDGERTVTPRFDLGELILDKVTVCRWDMSCAGDPSKYDSGLVLQPGAVNGSEVSVDLPDDTGGIFEVHAYFQGESHGDGYYTFCLRATETPPASEDIPFDSQAVRIVWREGMGERPEALIIRTRAELLDALQGEAGYESSADLLDEMAATCDEGFFAERELILLWIESGSGSIRYQVGNVQRTPAGVTVTIQRTVPEICTADMAAWLVFLQVPAGTAGETLRVVIQ